MSPDRFEFGKLNFPRVDVGMLDQWCAHHLESRIVAERFRSGRLSAVIGVVLADGREVVIKVRRPRTEAVLEPLGP